MIKIIFFNYLKQTGNGKNNEKKPPPVKLN